MKIRFSLKKIWVLVLGVVVVLMAGCDQIPEGIQGGDLSAQAAELNSGGVVEYTAVLRVAGENNYQIGDYSISFDSQSDIQPDLEVGTPVTAQVRVNTDGSLYIMEMQAADQNDDDQNGSKGSGMLQEPGDSTILNDEPGSEFEFSGQVSAIGEDSWTIDGKDIVVTGTNEIDPLIVVGDMVKVEGTLSGDQYLAREIQLVKDSRGDDSSEDSNMDSEDDDSSISDMHDGEDDSGDHDENEDSFEEMEFHLSGLVTMLDATTWMVGDQTVILNNRTEIHSGIASGATVRVEGVISDGRYIAHEVELVHSEDINQDSGGDDSVEEDDSSSSDQTSFDNEDDHEDQEEHHDGEDSSGGDHDGDDHGGSHDGDD